MASNTHVCPVWVGYLLASRFRNIFEDPAKILFPYIRSGMKILEIGPGMGFFSIPMAKITGPSGMVYCVDIQDKMLTNLKRKAVKKGVVNSIETIQASNESLNIGHLTAAIDFTLLAYVAHEIPDQYFLFSEVAKTMKKNTRVLFIEPKGHVNEEQWQRSLKTARECGFIPSPERNSKRNRIIELVKM